MTDDERREMARNNYAAQMGMLGYQPDGNPKDLVEVVRCKDCKHWRQNAEFCGRWSVGNVAQHTPSDWYCADGERK